jgi:hypothetical protein
VPALIGALPLWTELVSLAPFIERAKRNRPFDPAQPCIVLREASAHSVGRRTFMTVQL